MSMHRHDPINEKYFSILKTWESVSDRGFLVGIVLSFLILFVSEREHPDTFNAISIVFVVLSIALFGLGLAIRLFLAPNAEDRRREEFFATAYDVSLTADRTQKYYNNNVPSGLPVRKSAAQTLENSFFSKHVVARMFRKALWVTVIYFLGWITVLLIRDIPLSFALLVSQLIFSEHILARLIRLYWLKARFENTYRSIRSLFITKIDGECFDSQALNLISAYECTKSSAGISLSSQIFDSLNSELTVEWDRDRANLGI